jgi:hypothetical protein
MKSPIVLTFNVLALAASLMSSTFTPPLCTLVLAIASGQLAPARFRQDLAAKLRLSESEVGCSHFVRSLQVACSQP